MYFDEDLVLEIRLNTLNEIVDKFVIAEATKDHAGKEKKLNFNIKKFEKFKNKIEYIIIDDLPTNVTSNRKDWHENHMRDQYQRNSLERGYKNCDPKHAYPKRHKNLNLVKLTYLLKVAELLDFPKMVLNF